MATTDRYRGLLAVAALTIAASLQVIPQEADESSRTRVYPPMQPLSLDSPNPFQLSERFAQYVAGSHVITLDGTDITPRVSRQVMNVARGHFISPGITEYREFAAVFRADTDVTPGGQVVRTTQTGGRRWDGTFYGFPMFYRWRDPGAGPSHHAERFGGSAGGPIRQDRDFIFVEFQGVHRDDARILRGYVPSGDFRAEAKRAHPELAPILEGYPAGDRPVGHSPQILRFENLRRSSVDEDLLAIRLDHDSDKGEAQGNHVFLALRADSGRIHQPFSMGSDYLADTENAVSKPFVGTLHWAAASWRVNNELRLGYVRECLDVRYRSTMELPYLVSASGFTALSGNRANWSKAEVVSAGNAIQWHRGNHTLVAGGEVKHVNLKMRRTEDSQIYFSSPRALLANRVSSANYSAAIPVTSLMQWQESTFLQDNWRLHDNMVLQIGLRNEFFSQLHESAGRALPFDFNTCGETGFCPPGADFNEVVSINLDPRLSIAWAPLKPGAAALVLRAGGGLFHAPGLLRDRAQPVYNQVKNILLSAADVKHLSFPVNPFFADAHTTSAKAMDRRWKDSYAAQWAASVQGELHHRWQITATYFGAAGQNLPTSTYINWINPATQQRPHPEFGLIPYRANRSSSSFHALSMATIFAPYRGGARLEGGYTWGHEIDNGAAGDLTARVPQDPADLDGEWSSGDQDVRHSAWVRSSIPIPAHVDNRVLRALVSEWLLLGTFSGRTGLPLNVTIDRPAASVPTGYTFAQRPDRMAGVSVVPEEGRRPRQWIDPEAFGPVQGIYGTAARNEVRAPSRWGVDAALQREFRVPKKKFSVRARVTVSNLFNHANYNNPVSNWSTAYFGQIVNPYAPQCSGTMGPRCVAFTFDVVK